jgi:signal transduction histidine kinase
MAMSWTRSLYWRIALGFVVSLALMLVIQGLLFLWVVSRSGPTAPGQPPERLAEAVALDLSEAFAHDPGIDLAAYVNAQYGREAHPIFIVLADGRTAVNGGGEVPESFRNQARVFLQGRRQGVLPDGPDGRRLRRDPDGPPGAGARRGGPRFRGSPEFRPPRPALIVVNGAPIGVVLTPARAPFGFLLWRYAPTLAAVGTSVLVVGALVAAMAIFGPARRRLRAVEEAARRLGAGDLSVRVPADGGDEVAAVAGAFNAMAGELAARADALAASDHARRQLLADVSHELNTPVTAMRGYIETLTMPELQINDEMRARYLGIIGDETSRLERLIGDLLDLARLEGGGGTFALGEVSLGPLFARVAARHEQASRQSGVTIATVIEPGAGAVRGDAARLEQALQNLAANALRYAPAGSTIELRAQPAPDGVAVTMTDAGPGIAPEHLPHVFDRFYKADDSRSTTASGASAAKGSGLGLSIVKAIVERHGGRVEVASRPGHTVFRLILGSWSPSSPA